MASRFKNRRIPVFPYIDLIWVDDSTFAKMAEADPADARKERVPVINFRALLAMKLYALKDGQTRQHKDLLDIRALLSYGYLKIPDEEFKVLCERYSGPLAYDQIKSNS
ncbi:nucleotidyl transferase AbiEii/AbiGii toxin family protein [Luteolibacter yonseiensis]|uniref:Nucleotidyl transferase AbiEii/AbiGii toxin family protein n=1 Tax=Luteolibacter yonseiensis TaxID=1144680 RepID=A0A934VA58_9BACT|nr:nucleotidyl transferase AbiEii/AbiGii toxin family protein [Luteolibacter yonseiensis]MBK1815873.1 nucleotidyl transferase AbiEii/AbiGii toxin family protein [Luteolibacter yonseiensis]